MSRITEFPVPHNNHPSSQADGHADDCRPDVNGVLSARPQTITPFERDLRLSAITGQVEALLYEAQQLQALGALSFVSEVIDAYRDSLSRPWPLTERAQVVRTALAEFQTEGATLACRGCDHELKTATERGRGLCDLCLLAERANVQNDLDDPDGAL